jgi:predicted enzyme related to lactoylglutathione lyase
MEFDHPTPLGNNERGEFHRIGLTHFAMHVDDLDQAIEAVERYHGTVLRHTEVGDPTMGVRLIYVLDPNGVRIELMSLPGDKFTAPGEPV